MAAAHRPRHHRPPPGPDLGPRGVGRREAGLRAARPAPEPRRVPGRRRRSWSAWRPSTAPPSPPTATPPAASTSRAPAPSRPRSSPTPRRTTPDERPTTGSPACRCGSRATRSRSSRLELTPEFRRLTTVDPPARRRRGGRRRGRLLRRVGAPLPGRCRARCSRWPASSTLDGFSRAARRPRPLPRRRRRAPQDVARLPALGLRERGAGPGPAPGRDVAWRTRWS